MKKALMIVLALTLSLTLLMGCGAQGGTTGTPTPSGTAKATATPGGTTPSGKGVELALVTDLGTIDDKSLIRAHGKV